MSWRKNRRDCLSKDVVEYLRTPEDAHMGFGECYHAWTIQNYVCRGVEYVGVYTLDAQSPHGGRRYFITTVPNIPPTHAANETVELHVARNDAVLVRLVLIIAPSEHHNPTRENGDNPCSFALSPGPMHQPVQNCSKETLHIH
jgi:hypothetical protein